MDTKCKVCGRVSEASEQHEEHAVECAHCGAGSDDVEDDWRTDLASLVRQPLAEPERRSLAEGELCVDAPDSVREVIRITDSLIPIAPPTAPPPPQGSELRAARSARRFSALHVAAALLAAFGAIVAAYSAARVREALLRPLADTQRPAAAAVVGPREPPPALPLCVEAPLPLPAAVVDIPSPVSAEPVVAAHRPTRAPVRANPRPARAPIRVEPPSPPEVPTPTPSASLPASAPHAGNATEPVPSLLEAITDAVAHPPSAAPSASTGVR